MTHTLRLPLSCCALILSTIVASCSTVASAQTVSGNPSCKDFATHQDAVSFCLDRYGSAKGCGGLDRDNDGLPCECNAGGPEANEKACINWREENQ